MFLAYHAVEESRHPLLGGFLLRNIPLCLRLLCAKIVFVGIVATHKLLTRNQKWLALTFHYHQIVDICLVPHIFPLSKDFRGRSLKFELPVNQAFKEPEFLRLHGGKVSALAHLRLRRRILILINACTDGVVRGGSGTSVGGQLCHSFCPLRNMAIFPVWNLIRQQVLALCQWQLALSPCL